MTDPNHPHSESSSSDLEDRPLVSFLKANRPPVPEPHPQAEARLMQRIAQSPQAQQKTHTRRFTPKQRWLIGAIALSSALIAGVLWQLRSQNSGVFAQREIELEAFLIETWQEVSTDESLEELDWLSTPGAISQTAPASEALAHQSHFEESHP